MKNVWVTLQLCTKLNPFHTGIFLKTEECEMRLFYVQGHAIFVHIWQLFAVTT
jgi:hypothetical protein